MSKYLILISLVSIVSVTFSQAQQSILSQNCLKHDIPQKFGIMTTTYIRSGSTQMFKDYLQRYAQSQCSAYDNIYIIWNNDQSPQQMGVLANKDKWKKNVYFMQTVQNSLDFKYIVPEWVQQKVFFNMDDDFDISCETLTKGFAQWQQSSYGEIGPITAMYGRSFVFQPTTQSFTYIDQIKLNKKWKYYHFGLTGIAFISRHFLDLYYADIFQIKQMRKHVVEKFNCQDLLLNFLVSYMYPQVTPKYIELQFESLGVAGVSATATHRKYRAQCITKFSQILGYNPVRYVLAKNNQQLMRKKTNLQESCLVNLKQQHYEHTFISNRAYYLYIKRITGVENDFVKKENQRLNQAKKDIGGFLNKKKKENKMGVSGKKIKMEDVHLLSQGERKMFEEQEMMMHFGTQKQADKFITKFASIAHQQVKETTEPLQVDPAAQTKQNSNIVNNKQPSTPLLPVSVSQPISPNQQSQQPLTTSNSYQNTIYLIIILSIVVMLAFCLVKFIKTRKNKYDSVPVNIGIDM